MNDYFVRVLTVMCINAMLVVSMGLANGFTGVFSLGHVGFVGGGRLCLGHALALRSRPRQAYLPDLPAWLAGLQLALPVRRPSSPAWSASCWPFWWARRSCGSPAISSRWRRLGFLIIVNVVLINADDYTRGARTFTGVPLRDDAALGDGLAASGARCAGPHRLFAQGTRLARRARGYHRGAGDRHRRAADPALGLRHRRLLRRGRRLALRPLSRLLLAGRLLFRLYLLAHQHAGDRRHAEPDRRRGRA